MVNWKKSYFQCFLYKYFKKEANWKQWIEGLKWTINPLIEFDVGFLVCVNVMQVMLFGASDSYERDALMQITVAFNHFGKRLIQRMPRCRWGFVHVVNNDYTHWEMYAIGGSKHPTIISEGNRFIAPDNNFAKEVCTCFTNMHSLIF